MKISNIRFFFYITVILFPIFLFIAKIFSTNLDFGSKLSVFISVATICMCAAEDLISRTIPDFFNAIIFLSGTVFSFFTKNFRSAGVSVIKSGIFFIIMIIAFYVLKGGIGGGDVKLISAASAFIGPMNALWITAFAAMLASPLSIILIIKKHHRRKNKKTEQQLTLPFGPFYAICFLTELYSML